MVTGDDETLAERLAARGLLPPDDAAVLLRQVADELAGSHAWGIVHGNVSPETVRITPEGRAYLVGAGSPVDLGAASVAFAAPEVVDADQATRASDMWSLGATLFAVVEGATPFPGDTAVEIRQRIRTDQIPSSVRGRGLSWVIALLLSRDPHGRLSAAEVAEALGAIADRPRDGAAVAAVSPEAVAAAAVAPTAALEPAPRPQRAPRPRRAPQPQRAPQPAARPARTEQAAAAASGASIGWVLLLIASVLAITLMLLVG